MPVDMSIPNSIIAAYLQGVRLRQEREEAAGMMQFRQEEMERRREEFAQTIEARHKQLDLQSKLNESLIKSRLASEAETKARRALATTNLITKGLLIGQPTDNPDEVVYMGSLLGEGFEDIKGPSQAKIARDAASAAGMKAGAVAGATQPYKEDLAKLQSQLIGGRQEAQLKGQLESALKLQQVRTADAKELLELKRKGQLEIEHIRGGYRVQTAGMRKAEEGEEISEDMIKKAAEHAATGVINTADLPKVVGGIKNVSKVYAELSKSRLAPLNQKQIDNLEALKMVNRVGVIFKSMNDIIQAKGRGAFVDPAYAALKDELKQVAPLVRGLVKNAGAFSNQDADRAEGGAPSLNDGPLNTFSKTASQHKTDSFLQLVNDRRKSIMGKLSIRHQKMLQDAYGLTPDPDLEEVK